MLALLAAFASAPVVVSSEPFGTTDDGADVTAYTMQNDMGLEVTLISLGATIQSLSVPDRAGNAADVVLGFDDVAGYEGKRNPYFGCTVGRFANRIANARFDLDGTTYHVTPNIRGVHHIHGGGEKALSKVVWAGRSQVLDNGSGVVAFEHTSLDGEEGFPGTVHVRVRFVLSATANVLTIIYDATTDQPTPLNLTNHSYFNLNGHDGDPILNQRLRIASSRFTAVDDERMPTGDFVDVADTPYDFRRMKPIGRHIGEAGPFYDQNFVLDDDGSDGLPVAAVAVDPSSGRRMVCRTDQPAVQFYTPNMKPLPGKDGAVYEGRSSFCLETQHYPDSPNHAHFPSTIVTPEKPFRSRTAYAFSVVPAAEAAKQ